MERSSATTAARIRCACSRARAMPSRVAFNAPLWRMRVARVTDYFSVLNRGALPLAEIEVEANCGTVAVAVDWLPPGLNGLWRAGCMRKAGWTPIRPPNRKRWCSTWTRCNSTIFPRGSEPRGGQCARRAAGLRRALRMAAGGKGRPVGARSCLCAAAQVQAHFSLPFRWDGTDIKDWTVASGSMVSNGSEIELAPLGLFLRRHRHHRSRKPVDGGAAGYVLSFHGSTAVAAATCCFPRMLSRSPTVRSKAKCSSRKTKCRCAIIRGRSTSTKAPSPAQACIGARACCSTVIICAKKPACRWDGDAHFVQT